MNSARNGRGEEGEQDLDGSGGSSTALRSRLANLEFVGVGKRERKNLHF